MERQSEAGCGGLEQQRGTRRSYNEECDSLCPQGRRSGMRKEEREAPPQSPPSCKGKKK